MATQPERNAPAPGTRILHVVGSAKKPLGDVAALVLERTVAAGIYRVGLAAKKGVARKLLAQRGLTPRGLVRFELNIGTISNPVTDPVSAFALHRNYSHVDVVHAHGLYPAVVAALGMTALPHRHRPALVATVGRDKRGPLDRAAARIVASRAAVVLGTTQAIADRFENAVPVTGRARLKAPDVPHALAPSQTPQEFRNNLNIPAGTWVIAAPLQLVEGQTLRTVLRAAELLRETRLDRKAIVLLTGDGLMRPTLKKLARGSDSYRVIGPELTVDAIAAADVVIASENMSGMRPDTLMQLARPVVAVGDEQFHTEFGDTAALVPDGDPGAVAREINALLDDPARRASAGVRSRKRIIAVDAEDEIVAHLLDAYCTALEHRR